MRILTSTLALLGLLGACSSSDDRIPFDGQYFNAKARKVDGQYDVFTVSVNDVSRSIAGARAAGEYEAIRYCVSTYGNSDIIWTVGPDAPEAQLRSSNDTIVLQGICPQ